MPDYVLWIVEGDQEFPSVHARNDEHAVAIYSEQLGIRLTLEDQDLGAYGMLRKRLRETDRYSANKPDIPVWRKDPR
jgi:hypothetical protein